MIRPIEPAVPSYRDGAAYSESYGDTYWSLDGGLDETRHVFLSGNDLPARWQSRDRFTILETGFGTGLNFLCTWQLFRGTAPDGARLHYLSVDKHPFRAGDLQRLYGQWPELAPLGAALLERYPPLIPGFHRLHLDGGRVALTLLFGEAAEMLAQVEARVDAFFLDGFAPARNPDMWSEALFAQIGRLAAPGATCATYSAAGKVSRGMTAAGFAIEKSRVSAASARCSSGAFPARRKPNRKGNDAPSSSAAASPAAWWPSASPRAAGPSISSSGATAWRARPRATRPACCSRCPPQTATASRA
ncbi:hypothetical protein MASR1M97_00570 [Candidatus Desulfobacillus denitrificans]